jgi:hypothetical protein
MSNPKTAIQEIKSLMVKFGFIADTTKLSFVDAKLVDGTQIKVEGESLMEGAKVVVVTEEGEIPAPDGIHEIEGGVKVQTTDGIIVKLEEPEMEGEGDVEEVEMEDVPVEAIVPAEVAPIAEPVIAAIVEAIVPVLEEIKSLTEEMKKMKEKMGSVQSDFEAFKKLPAGKKISDGKVDFNKQENFNSSDAKIEAIMNMRKNK